MASKKILSVKTARFVIKPLVRSMIAESNMFTAIIMSTPLLYLQCRRNNSNKYLSKWQGVHFLYIFLNTDPFYLFTVTQDEKLQ